MNGDVRIDKFSSRQESTVCFYDSTRAQQTVMPCSEKKPVMVTRRSHQQAENSLWIRGIQAVEECRSLQLRAFFSRSFAHSAASYPSVVYQWTLRSRMEKVQNAVQYASFELRIFTLVLSRRVPALAS